MKKRKVIITILRDENFEKEVLENPEPVLVEFRAGWSGPCDIMAPVIESLAAEYKGQLRFTSLDIESNEKTTKEYGIIKLPTILFFDKGRVVNHIIGVVPKRLLESQINALLETALTED